VRFKPSNETPKKWGRKRKTYEIDSEKGMRIKIPEAYEPQIPKQSRSVSALMVKTSSPKPRQRCNGHPNYSNPKIETDARNIKGIAYIEFFQKRVPSVVYN